MKLKVDKLTYGPDAMGRLEDRVVFVPGAIPGDEVEVTIAKKQSNYWRAEIVKVISRSDKFVKAPCPVYGKCGGCHWQNVPYEGQLEWKRKVVTETIAHLGGLKDFEVEPVIGCSKPFGYRNKIQQPLAFVKGEVVSGFFQRGSHRIVPVRKCMLETGLGNKVVERAREVINKHHLKVYNERAHKGLLRHLIVRTSNAEAAALLTVVAVERFSGEEKFAADIMKSVPAVKGVFINVNNRRNNVILGAKTYFIKGEKQLKEKIGDMEFIVSPDSFFQTNTIQAEELCRQVEALACLTGEETVVDLYSGVGMIGMYLAAKAKKVVFIENDSSSVSDALKNAGLNKLDNLKFFEGAVETLLFKNRLHKEADVVILDPPRQGVGAKVIAWIKKARAKKVIYVSCDLGTFCRDMKYLREAGYDLKKLIPIDMFPQTYHMEIVGEFTPGKC